MSILITSQACTVCGLEKPLDDFYQYKRTLANGESKVCRYRHCKTCHLAKTNKWRKNNTEEVREINKRLNQKYRDRRLEYMREYHRSKGRQLQTEEQKERRRDAARKNPDRIAEYRQRWMGKPGSREKYNTWQANRRARQRGAEGSFSTQEWIDLCSRSKGKCLCCGDEKPLSVDHVIPLSLGGSNSIENIQPLCFSCNSSKGTAHIDYRTWNK